MMNFKLTWKVAALSLATLATISGCSNDDFDNVSSQGQTVITAGFEQPGAKTRTAVNSSNQVVWLKNDAFKLFYTQAGGSVESSVFTTSDDTKQTSASFTGTALPDGATAKYAVYPAANVKSLVGSTVTMILPSELTAGEASNGPMWTDADSYITGLEFSHLAGLLKLTISGLPVGEDMYLKVTSSENIAGTATANLGSTESKPYLTISNDDSPSKVIKVTGINLSAENNAKTATATFYVPLPVATLGTLTVGIYDNDNNTLLFKEKTWTNVAVARASIRSASFGFEQISVDENISQKIQSAVSEAESTVTTTVEISGDLKTDENETNKTISVPAVENKNVALVFANAPTTSESSALTIQNTMTTSQTDAVNTITLSLPATNENDAVENVVINTPQSTFELTSSATEDSQTTKYTTITATTANNTLVVGDKVEIETIKVKGGNIRLKKGSTVKTITNSTDGKIIVYKELGATLTNNPTDSNIEVIDTDLDANLETILAKGGSYILPAELNLTKPLDVYGEVTFDLNGNKVTCAAGFSGGALFLVHRGGTLIVNDSKGGGSIDSYNNNWVSGILLTASSDETNEAIKYKNAIVEINAGTIKGNDFAVVGNGSRHGTQITINGGTLKSNVGSGIYHPQDGTLTIKGGTITGKETGVELRSGKLIITGGTFTSTAESATCVANGSGTTTAGAALAVVQHTTKKAIDVTISGGTFNGVYSLFQKDIQNNNPDNVTMSVTGGTFNGEVYSQNCANFITGGTFKNFEVATQRVTVSDADAFVMSLSNRAAANITVANSINLSDRTIEELTLKEHKGININENVTIQLGNKNRIEANKGLSLTGSGKIDNTSSDHSNLGQGWQKSLIHLLGGETIIDGITMVNDMSYHWYGDSNLGRPYNSACVSYWSDANITVRNAKFYSGGFTICGMGRSDNSARVTLINSYFESNSSNKDNGIAWSYAMRLFGNQINIDQCEVKGVQGGIAVELCQNATIKSGKFYTVNSGENKDAFYPLYVSNRGIVTIEGGDFIGANSWSNLAEGKSAVVASDNDQGWPTGSVILKGGRFNGKAYNSISNITYNPADGYEWKAISDDPNLIWEVVKSSNE